MKQWFYLFGGLFIIIGIASCTQKQAALQPTSEIITPVPSYTADPQPTATPHATITPIPTITATSTHVPTVTPIPTISATSTPIPTVTPGPSPELVPYNDTYMICHSFDNIPQRAVVIESGSALEEFARFLPDCYAPSWRNYSKEYSLWSLILAQGGAIVDENGNWLGPYAFLPGTYHIFIKKTDLPDGFSITPDVPAQSPVFVTLGSPFLNCGDSVPRIHDNDAYNGPGYLVTNDLIFPILDDHHGHVNYYPPLNCDPWKTNGEVTAPVSGRLVLKNKTYNGFDGYQHGLFFDPNVYPAGIIEALKFAGIQNPDLSKVSNLHLNIAHFNGNEALGYVTKGQSIGNLIRYPQHYTTGILSYSVFLEYSGVPYYLSSTLFTQDVQPTCILNSGYDCIPEKYDYAPSDPNFPSLIPEQ